MFVCTKFFLASPRVSCHTCQICTMRSGKVRENDCEKSGKVREFKSSWPVGTLYTLRNFLSHPVEQWATELFSFSCVSCRVSNWKTIIQLNTGLFGRNIPPWKDMAIWLPSQGNYPLNLHPQYFPCWNDLIHISLVSPRKILWRQNHEDSFIGQGISFAAPWPWICLGHSMIFYWECKHHLCATVLNVVLEY